jgi:hypothetical protein
VYKIKKTLALSILSVFALSFSALPFVIAQDTTNQNGGGSGLQLSPTRTELSGQPGEKKSFSISLKNITQGELNAQVFLNDFESDNVSGTPQIIVDENRDKTPYSLKGMITSLESVNLKPGETKQIEHFVDIPGNAAPGAYFGALRYAAIPVNSDTTVPDRQVSLTASVAHLVFVEVPGDVVQQIRIEKLIALGSDGKERNIFKKPSKAELTVKNLGNGFSKPFGKVSIENGSKQIYSYDINNVETKAIVLPQSSRVFTDDISNVTRPGKYKMTAGIAYGNGGEVVNLETSFWYLPLWFVAILAVVLIALVVGGWMIYRRISGGGFKKSKKS